jgi:endonuclease/exonuclease/phosphatase family metal-dependent hydrolase
MRSLRVTTWNVLHRVHAVNWKEAPVTAFPSEATRVARITARVASWLDDGVSVVCLQEVSGDQVASLRSAIADGAQIFAHRYPRLPRIRGIELPELEDPTEHLVTIVTTGPSAVLRAAKTFDTDPGKGFLAIDIGDDITLIDTHVTARERGRAQMIDIAAFALETSARAIVMGDFNAPIDVVRDVFGAASAITQVGDLRPTRIPTADRSGRTIDHVVVVGGVIASASVLDGELLSDHNPVTATVTFGEHPQT